MTLPFFKGREERKRFATGKSLPFLPVSHQRRVIPNGAQRNERSPSVTDKLKRNTVDMYRIGLLPQFIYIAILRYRVR
jgi:hypothetical protein